LNLEPFSGLGFRVIKPQNGLYTGAITPGVNFEVFTQDKSEIKKKLPRDDDSHFFYLFL
jgi:hypothetical protein